jgi:hypothetical protein
VKRKSVFGIELESQSSRRDISELRPYVDERSKQMQMGTSEFENPQTVRGPLPRSINRTELFNCKPCHSYPPRSRHNVLIGADTKSIIPLGLDLAPSEFTSEITADARFAPRATFQTASLSDLPKISEIPQAVPFLALSHLQSVRAQADIADTSSQSQTPQLY